MLMLLKSSCGPYVCEYFLPLHLTDVVRLSRPSRHLRNALTELRRIKNKPLREDPIKSQRPRKTWSGPCEHSYSLCFRKREAVVLVLVARDVSVQLYKNFVLSNLKRKILIQIRQDKNFDNEVLSPTQTMYGAGQFFD